MFPSYFMLDHPGAVLVAIFSIARTVRFLIFDDFPPMMWVRARLLARFHEDSKWKAIITCPFCLAPYVTIGIIAWAYFSHLHWSWWLVNIWWAVSYLAAIIVAYDEAAE